MNTKKNSSLGSTAIVALFLLRTAIGWHFLYEGLTKLLTPSWTSADYLQIANGIFPGFFHAIANNPTTLMIIDQLNIWGLILIGLSLMIGWWDRWAALAGMLLLAIYWMANPPLISNDFGLVREGKYLIVDKNFVELLALLVLVILPTGKHFGLEHLVFAGKKSATTSKEPQSVVPEPIETESTTTLLNRRSLLRGLSFIPFAGAFGYAFIRKSQWQSYEEKNLVDAVTGASIKTFDAGSLKQLKGTPFHRRKLKRCPSAGLSLEEIFFPVGHIHVISFMFLNLSKPIITRTKFLPPCSWQKNAE